RRRARRRARWRWRSRKGRAWRILVRGSPAGYPPRGGVSEGAAYDDRVAREIRVLDGLRRLSRALALARRRGAAQPSVDRVAGGRPRLGPGALRDRRPVLRRTGGAAEDAVRPRPREHGRPDGH